MILKPGSIISSRYEIKKEIGSGGTSYVYEAYDKINKKDIALKIFKNEINQEDELYKEFINECVINSSLNNINIIALLNNGIYESHPFIINELIKGSTLKDILDKRSYLTIDESIDIMIQLLNALLYAHNHKCIHKDVKPNNIFILNDGTLKLGDFGISEIMNTNKNDTKIVASVQYCAPEIFLGNSASIASDIYSSGIVFYEMLTGKVPFDEIKVKMTALAHVKNKFPSLREHSKNFPKKLEKIILKSVEKNPNKRYKNCQEFIDELIRFKTQK